MIATFSSEPEMRLRNNEC